RLDAPGLEHTHGERDLLHVIALVVVEPALHDRNGLPRQRADDEPALVTRHRAALPARDPLVGDAVGVLHLLGEGTEPAAEDNRDRRLFLREAGDRVDRGLGVDGHIPGSFKIFCRNSERNGRAWAVRTSFAGRGARETITRSPARMSCSTCPSTEMR